MASEWAVIALGEVAAVRSGFAFKSRDWTEHGIPVVKIANVKSGRLDMAGCSFVAESVANGAGDFLLSAGDILIAMTGYVGDVARVRRTDLPCVLNQRVGKFTVLNSERLDADYLFQFLAWADTKQTVAGLGYGSAQPNVSPSLIHKVEIPLPPLPEQKRIAHILGTLDDKIELNRRMNATLEAMSRAIFKSWFVDFDPVRQKAAGKQPVGMDAETAALFPDSFEDSGLGEVPTGWRVRRLSDIMTFEGGSQPPASEFISEPIDGYVRLVQIRDFKTDSHVTFVPDTKKLRRFTEDDIMLARYGSSGNAAKTEDSLARVCRGLSGAYNVALVKVIPKTDCREFLGCFLRSPAFQGRIKGMGGRSVQSGFRKEDLGVIPIVTPSEKVHQVFEQTVAGIWEHDKAMAKQSRTLAALRDTLLPKLLSGEIRVPEAEEAVEEAVG